MTEPMFPRMQAEAIPIQPDKGKHPADKEHLEKQGRSSEFDRITKPCPGFVLLLGWVVIRYMLLGTSGVVDSQIHASWSDDVH